MKLPWEASIFVPCAQDAFTSRNLWSCPGTQNKARAHGGEAAIHDAAKGEEPGLSLFQYAQATRGSSQ